MRHAIAIAAAAVMVVVGAAPALAGATVDPTTRTVEAGAFVVTWSLADPEEVVDLRWNGSDNLTNASPNYEYPCDGDSEFFGNSWALEGGTSWIAPVGAGSTGQWARNGTAGVAIASSASDCFGTSGIPVATRYRFYDQGAKVDSIFVQRRFSIGTTPIETDFRPFVPRLTPRDSFDTVLHPNADGSALIVEDVNGCEFGCLIEDWNQSWFAVHDQYAQRGMIVRHLPSEHHAALWVDADGYSQTTASSVALLAPEGGFVGTVVETEQLCFYDSASWSPGLALPAGC